MRVNIYEEELTNDVAIVETVAENTGQIFYGVRCFFKSHPDLHHSALDDDRSAVTWWVGTRENAQILRDALQRSLNAYVVNHQGKECICPDDYTRIGKCPVHGIGAIN